MSRIVGYAGFVPGKQHVFGEKFGASAAESLRERADANTANSYLQKHEQRTSSKLDLTNVPSSNHLPGYAGHIPGLDAGNAKTFGTSTTSALQKSAEQIKGACPRHPPSLVPGSLGRQPCTLALTPACAGQGVPTACLSARAPQPS